MCLCFYAKYANMHPVHSRHNVVWITDHTRPFAIVLIETTNTITPLLPIAHLGVGVKSRQEVDRLCQLAKLDQCPLENRPSCWLLGTYPRSRWSHSRNRLWSRTWPHGRVCNLSATSNWLACIGPLTPNVRCLCKIVQAIKLNITSITGLSKDALHIYVGLATLLTVAVVLRKPLQSYIPWLAVLIVAVAGELVDMRDDLASFGYWRWRASLHDVLNTLFWPSVLLLLARQKIVFRT